ncbi:MAG: hypothetical protein JXR95_03425 [Deltaproteobacteria bacterium]|nr:hypothetical protein [Deltaproteobacteria bacterium]
MSDIKKKIRFYGILDLIFSVLYLIVFVILLPAHDPFARFMTVFFPVLLGISGIMMVLGLKFSREIGMGIASMFIAVCLLSISLLAYTIGYFKGIYGPLGQGITIVSYLAIALVIEMFGIWPFFQLKALWKLSSSEKAGK